MGITVTFFRNVLCSLLLLTGPGTVQAQNLKDAWNNIKKGAARDVDKAFNDPRGTVNTIINGARSGTRIRKSDFYQSPSIAPPIPGNTRYALAKNLLIDLKGTYPESYAPSWNYFNRNAALSFDVDNYIVRNPLSPTESRNIMIGDYKGKAALLFHAGCDCIADILIDSMALLTEQPQTFKVTNFRKFQNNQASGDRCAGAGNIYTAGGFEGKISLSVNADGDILMSLMIENYRLADRFAAAGVSYRFHVEDIRLENEMTAEKAREKVAREAAAKQRQKDFLARSKKQVDSLMKVIARKYPGPECRSCFYRNRGYSIDPSTTEYVNVRDGSYAGSRTDYNLNTSLVIRNKCKYAIMFVGIQQLYDEEKGYDYTDVTRTMESGYEYTSDQGMFAYAFTSILGMNPDFVVQDQYNISAATTNSIQWLRVIRSKE